MIFNARRNKFASDVYWLFVAVELNYTNAKLTRVIFFLFIYRHLRRISNLVGMRDSEYSDIVENTTRRERSRKREEEETCAGLMPIERKICRQIYKFCAHLIFRVFHLEYLRIIPKQSTFFPFITTIQLIVIVQYLFYGEIFEETYIDMHTYVFVMLLIYWLTCRS